MRVGVLIGRFQGFHNGHADIFRQVSGHFDQLIVLVGSTGQPRSYKNPFLYTDIKYMMDFNKLVSHRQSATIRAVADIPESDSQWVDRIMKIAWSSCDYSDATFTLIGHKKDGSSYYLDLFDTWDFFPVKDNTGISGVNIRDAYFREEPDFQYLKTLVPPSTLDFLVLRHDTPWFYDIIKDRNNANV